jgi:predicted chitinase
VIHVTREQILSLAPPARNNYLGALATIDETLAKGEVNATPLRLAHFFAQMLHESGGFRLLRENLNYTTTARLCAVWPSRFQTRAAAQPFVNDPYALAEHVYGGRMGNTSPGDGWKFRGRGVPMLTGRSNYATTGARIGINLETNPDLVIDPRYIFAVAVDFWTSRNLHKYADADDLKGVTRKILGAAPQRELDERGAWLVRTKAVWS